MLGFTGEYAGVDLFFLICAVLGVALFLFRLVLQLIGQTGGADDPGDVDAGETDDSFRVLSLHGLTAFFMMFGLVGLALHRQSECGETISIVGALVAGTLACWGINKLFAALKSMQSDGMVRVENAVGAEGSVYLGIPENGTGKVQVAVQGRLKVYDAVSQDRGEIRTGERIVVVQASGGSSLVVKKA